VTAPLAIPIGLVQKSVQMDSVGLKRLEGVDFIGGYEGNPVPGKDHVLGHRREERIEKEGSIYIRKDCGMFVCEK